MDATDPTTAALTALTSEVHKLATDLRGEMHAMKDELRGEMHVMKDELRGEMHAMKDELRGEMHVMKDELRGEIKDSANQLGAMIEQLEDQVRLVAEGHAAHEQRLTAIDSRLDGVADDVTLLKMGVGRLETRLAGVERHLGVPPPRKRPRR